MASHVARRVGPRPPAHLPGELSVQVAASEENDGVRLVYRDLSPAALPAETLPVVLLHGSPGSGADLAAPAAVLSRRRRVLVLDLPGFGRSSRDLPEVSVRALAAHVREWLAGIGVDRAHILGFSLGGGVALQLADLDPERVASLVLVSSIGVQELELLGSYRANHALHRAQLALVWLAHEAFPHFGAFDGAAFDVAYARSFVDTDQRPLRGILQRLSAPVLFLHGRRDPLVPHAAALEHRRIVPHSELFMFQNASHFLPWSHPAELAGRTASFLDRVEAGEAPGREAAEPERLAEAAEPFSRSRLPPPGGLPLLVLTGLLFLGTLVSEDLTCVAAGLLVARGLLPVSAALAACAAGIWIGDMVLYFVGRSLGSDLLRRGPWRFLAGEGALRSAGAWLRRRGLLVVLLTRFVPGARVPTYLAAGVVGVGFFRVGFWFLIGVAVWTPLVVGVSALAGGLPVSVPGLLAVGLLVWAAWAIGAPALTARGRGVLRARWQRLTTWEFWPLWIFYLPVAAKILVLALRHRSLALVSAVNPGMPEGGLVGESKHDILQRLPQDAIARTLFLPAARAREEVLRLVSDFRAEHALGERLVVKPDLGERGRGVRGVRTERELLAALEAIPGAALVQEHVEGPELGLFYARHPDEEQGRIFSITEKRLPEVVGDGERTIEQLILADERAALIAPTYFAENAETLFRIPSPGERVRLVEVGTHCRGALFLDGARLHSPAMEEALERISRAFPGFHFGRYDVRGESLEAMRAGKFRVLELNGMTSEATHVYDPGYSLPDAYRALFAQWELAFEIAAANRDRGARPASLRAMIRRLISSRQGEAGGTTAPSPP